MRSRTVLIYDGDCGFCRWGMHLVRRLDVGKFFTFCPFGRPVAEEALSRLDPEKRYSSYHALAGEVLHSGTDAARVTLEGLPMGKVLTALSLHRLYPLIAVNRATLGRLVPGRPIIDDCSRRPESSRV